MTANEVAMMSEVVAVLHEVTSRLEDWVEIAETHDQRPADHNAIAKARALISRHQDRYGRKVL